jgi:hypothetical protein
MAHWVIPLVLYYRVVQKRGVNNSPLFSDSKSMFGKILILMMGLYKFHRQIPEFNYPFLYNQGNGTYGD